MGMTFRTNEYCKLLTSLSNDPQPPRADTYAQAYLSGRMTSARLRSSEIGYSCGFSTRVRDWVGSRDQRKPGLREVTQHINESVEGITFTGELSGKLLVPGM